jgi:hypothetical protein
MLNCHCFSTSLWRRPLRGFKKNQDGFKLNGTHRLLVYADDVTILGGRVCNIEKNMEALVVVRKDVDTEVNGNKTKYIIMSSYQNAGQVTKKN